MKVLTYKKYLIALAIVSMMIIAPNVKIVAAISQDAVIEDITHDDIGIEGLYTFFNVTYNIDGTGTDVLESSAGFGASLESFSEFKGQESFSGRLHTAIGRGVFGPSEGSGSGISSGESLWTYDKLETKFNPAGSGSAIGVTNQTTAGEIFDYDEKERYDTGGHDFSSNFDSDTTWWNANCSTAANAFNISSEYQSLNESLTEAIDIDDFFNNAGDNAESKTSLDYYNQHTKGESFVVGYENAEDGIINDLRSYLALINNKDFSDIVITNYNLSTAQFSYNMSEHLTGQIRKAVDYHLDQADSASSALLLTVFGAPVLSLGTTSLTKLGGGSGSSIVNGPVSSRFNRIGTSFRASAISFGTRLKQFGSSAINWLGDKIQGAQTMASNAYHTVGGTIKSALSPAWKALQGGANHVVNVVKSIGPGINNIVQKGVQAVTSFATGLVKVFTNPIFILAIIAIVFIVGYVVLKKTDKI